MTILDEETIKKIILKHFADSGIEFKTAWFKVEEVKFNEYEIHLNLSDLEKD